MNKNSLKNWAGLFSIVWMIGGAVLIADVLTERISHIEPTWLWALVIFLLLIIWLGLGLGFAIVGLRRGNLAGRLFALVAVGVFIFFVWQTVGPAFSRARQRGASANAADDVRDRTGELTMNA